MNQLPVQPNPIPLAAQKPPRRPIIRAPKWVLFLLVVSIGVSFLTAFGYELVKKADIRKEANSVARQLDTDQVYTAGVTKDCVEQGPTGFGEITGVRVCNVIVAKAYFVRYKAVPDETQIDDGSGGYTTVPMQSIMYVRADGKPVDADVRVIQTGTPTTRSGMQLRYKELKQLGIESNVVFSVLDSKDFQRETLDPVLGPWRWQAETSWLGSDSPGEKLKDKIDKKITTDVPIAKGAPKTSEALKQGRAPIVVYFIDRYCHSPSILLLDYMCILPG